jgi:uncharacterized protein YbjT (DUF2867 family)
LDRQSVVRKQATSLPEGAEVAIGGLLDLPAVAKAPDGVDKLYLTFGTP